MRWPIRNQILVPLLAIQGIAVLATISTTAALAARRSEREIIEKLAGVVATLGHSNFPYTAGVLAQMRGLSGAHFIAYSRDGDLTETSLSTLPSPRLSPTSAREMTAIQGLADAHTVTIQGERYFAILMRTTPTASALMVLYPEKSWKEARWEAAMPPLALGAISLVLMAGCTSFIAHRISRRIQQVEGAVANIAAGDFVEIDAGDQPDEVRDLVRSINHMSADLKQMSAAIGRSERARLLAQLAAGLAHQLRNSLTGARMSVQLHARRYPPPECDQSLNVALRQLSLTEEQVQLLLSLGSPAAQKSDSCDLIRLLNDVASLVEPSCGHAKVGLAKVLPPDPVVINGDETGLRSALINLAQNAIEAAGPGGGIGLGIQSIGNDVILEVSDTGAGPPANLAKSLFDPFVTGKPEGIGLGLAVARQVATDHGGELIWTREESRTVFRLKLPGRQVTSPKGGFHESNSHRGRRAEHLLGLPRVSHG